MQQLREALRAHAHHAVVAPAPEAPTVLRIESPAALTGVAEALLRGREKALARAGFHRVECVGVDPGDARGRHGLVYADVPRDEAGWVFTRLSAEERVARLLEGDELPTRAHLRVVEAARESPVAAVLSLGEARRRRDATRRRTGPRT